MIINLLLGLLTTSTLGSEYPIQNPRDLKIFSEDVGNGKNFNGTTVVLTSDLDMSSYPAFLPIGQDASKYFNGDFDGQGHVLSNLKVVSATQYSALFGYARGLTVSNLVLDSTCTVSNDYSGYEACYASIIGACEGTAHECVLESLVNMAGVTFTGVVQRHLWIAGIAGVFFPGPDGTSAQIHNCINYGAVTNTGKAYVNKYASGIIGEFYGGSIANCANYGTLFNNDTSSPDKLLMGGIAAASRYAKIENCVSAGKISTAAEGKRLGTIIGGTWSTFTEIHHSYWTADVGQSYAHGDNESSATVMVKDSSLARSFDAARLEEINRYNSSWAKWFMLHTNKSYICDVRQDPVVVIHRYIPSPRKEGYSFVKWSTDERGEGEYFPNSTGPQPSDVYAIFSILEYDIVFDFGNETTLSKRYLFDTDVEYPEVGLRKGFRFVGWSESFEKMPGRNVVVYAQWKESAQFVEIIFTSVTLERKDVQDVLAKFAGAGGDSAKVWMFDPDTQAGETRVVVEFGDRDAAEAFVNSVDRSDKKPENIKAIDYTGKPEGGDSFSAGIVPLILGLLIFSF